ncbi:MAG: hypothetical protein R3Y64_00635 [Peptostreptococcaceae bacterium]
MKKTTMGLLVFMSALSIGCVNQNQSQINKYVEMASKDTDSLINTNYKDIQGGFGVPHSSIYYIDADKFMHQSLDEIDAEEIKDSVTALSIYRHPDQESKFLHVYFDKGVVKDASVGSMREFTDETLLPKEKIQDADYRLQFFKNKGSIYKETFNLNNARDLYIGKNINEFNNAYKVVTSNFKATKINDNSNIYFYNLVNFDPTTTNAINNSLNVNYQINTKPNTAIINPINNSIQHVNEINYENSTNYSSTSLAVKTNENNKIESIKILNKDETYDLINKSFDLKK